MSLPLPALRISRRGPHLSTGRLQVPWPGWVMLRFLLACQSAGKAADAWRRDNIGMGLPMAPPPQLPSQKPDLDPFFSSTTGTDTESLTRPPRHHRTSHRPTPTPTPAFRSPMPEHAEAVEPAWERRPLLVFHALAAATPARQSAQEEGRSRRAKACGHRVSRLEFCRSFFFPHSLFFPWMNPRHPV